MPARGTGRSETEVAQNRVHEQMTDHLQETMEQRARSPTSTGDGTKDDRDSYMRPLAMSRAKWQYVQYRFDTWSTTIGSDARLNHAWCHAARQPVAQLLCHHEPCFLGFIRSRMKRPAMRRMSRRIIFRLVIFLWYPDATLSSVLAPLTSSFIRSTL